jgi:hypothetical protein
MDRDEDSERSTPGRRRHRRRERIRAEIERNRRGEATIPTWVLAVTLVVVVGTWLALVILS